MSSVIMGSRCMTASSSNDEPSQDGLFHRLRGLATARCGHDGRGAKPDRAARWASGGLRPAVLSSPPRPELQYHRRTGPRGRGVDPDRRRPKVSDESQAVGLLQMSCADCSPLRPDIRVNRRRGPWPDKGKLSGVGNVNRPDTEPSVRLREAPAVLGAARQSGGQAPPEEVVVVVRATPGPRLRLALPVRPTLQWA